MRRSLTVALLPWLMLLPFGSSQGAGASAARLRQHGQRTIAAVARDRAAQAGQAVHDVLDCRTRWQAGTEGRGRQKLWQPRRAFEMACRLRRTCRGAGVSTSCCLPPTCESRKATTRPSRFASCSTCRSTTSRSATAWCFAWARSQTDDVLPGATVCYVWDAHLPVGTTMPSPFTSRLRYMVLESGSARRGQWVDERRDVAADFLRLFGDESTDGAHDRGRGGGRRCRQHAGAQRGVRSGAGAGAVVGPLRALPGGPRAPRCKRG